jgi:hypothetical protein
VKGAERWVAWGQSPDERKGAWLLMAVNFKKDVALIV